MMISAPKMSDDFCEKIAKNVAMAPYTPIRRRYDRICRTCERTVVFAFCFTRFAEYTLSVIARYCA